MRARARQSAVAIALILSAAVPAVVVAQGPCATGDALLDAGRLDQARAWAADVETTDPCLDDVHEAIADQRGEAVSLLERAKTILDLDDDELDPDDKETARELLARAVALDAGLTEAEVLLTESLGLAPTATPSPSPTPGPYAGTRALADDGFTTAAKEAAVKGAETGEDVPDDLRYLGDTPWLLIPLLGVLPAAVVSLIPAALLTALLLILLGPWLFARFFRERFLVEDLSAPEGAVDAGKQIAVIVEDGLRQAKHEGGGNSLSLVPAPDPQIELPEEVESLPYGKFIGAALNLLLPPRLKRLQGQLHVADGRVVGATVSLVSPQNTVQDSVAIWLADYETAPVTLTAEEPDETSAKALHVALQSVAAAIGSWAMFALHVDDDAKKKRAILTADWESLAAMRVGALYHRTNQERARDLYVKALQFDAGNTGALFNLGWLDMSAAEWERASTRLADTLRRVEGKNKEAGIPNHSDRLWYRCAYNLAAAQFHLWIGGKNREQLLQSARSNAAVVAASALDARERAPLGSLRGFLTLAAQASLVLLADTMAARPPRPGNTEPTRPTNPIEMCEALTKPPKKGANLRRHWPSGEAIIEYVLDHERQTYGLAHRVRYNLACYFAQRGFVRVAFRELDLAFEHGELLEYAETDPSLAPLRTPERRARWDALKAKHSAEAPPDPYARWWTKKPAA